MDDALFTNGQAAVGFSPQKAVKSDEYVFPQIGFDDFRPVGRHIKAFQPGINNIAAYLLKILF
jgi:hypothetical protein